ncbi:MAG TPA: class I SAM-dependent methyltransferase [Cyclobacteriaceae bacterium]
MTTRLNRFNWIASYYDKLVNLIFGKSILEAQHCHLELIPAHANILVLGGGSGKWVSEIIKTNKTCHILFVDASSKMMDQAKYNLEGVEQVSFIHGTQNDLPNLHFDVIITHFFFDMFTTQQLHMLIEQLDRQLNSPSLWIVSDFEKSKYWHSLMLKMMFLFFKLSNTIENNDLPDWNDIMKSQHFKVSKTMSLYGDFIQSRLYVK